MKSYVIDFDDLCDNVMVQDGKDLVSFLGEWKEKVPPLKITLFTIPKRCSSNTISSIKSLGDWVALAPHGWRHTRGECLAWAKEECMAKINAAKEMGIDAPVFRAPAWLLDGEVYEACGELDYTIASHKDFRIPGTNVKEYVYNLHMGVDPPRTRRLHGHLPNVSGNWVYDMQKDGLLKTDKNGEYKWPWEVSTIVPANIIPDSNPEEVKIE